MQYDTGIYNEKFRRFFSANVITHKVEKWNVIVCNKFICESNFVWIHFLWVVSHFEELEKSRMLVLLEMHLETIETCNCGNGKKWCR